MTRDGASGAEGRAPPERSPAAPTAPPRPCRTGVEDVPAPGRRGHRAGAASRGCDEGGHAGRCQEGSVLGDKRRGRLEMCPEFVSLCLSGGHRDVRAAAHGIGPCSPAAATRLARARSRRGSGGGRGAEGGRRPDAHTPGGGVRFPAAPPLSCSDEARLPRDSQGPDWFPLVRSPEAPACI